MIVFFLLLGKYLTLSWLKQLKNGDTVEIHYITTDLMDLNIPSQIKQDVPSPNFEEKVYFKKVKEAIVWYYSNTNGDPTQMEIENWNFCVFHPI